MRDAPWKVAGIALTIILFLAAGWINSVQRANEGKVNEMDKDMSSLKTGVATLQGDMRELRGYMQAAKEREQ